jgi:hypothetical protein
MKEGTKRQKQSVEKGSNKGMKEEAESDSRERK